MPMAMIVNPASPNRMIVARGTPHLRSPASEGLDESVMGGAPSPFSAGMLVGMNLYVIEETALPTAPGSPGWDDFVGVVAVRNAAEVAGYGTPEVQDPPEEMLIAWNDPQEPKRLFVVRA